MGGRKITITFDDVLYEKLKQRAQDEGFVRVPILMRYLIAQGMNAEKEDADKKAITVLVDNYEEIAGYVREKKLGKPEVFAVYAMEQHMQRYPLSKAQKERAGKNIG